MQELLYQFSRVMAQASRGEGARGEGAGYRSPSGTGRSVMSPACGNYIIVRNPDQENFFIFTLSASPR